LRSICVYSARRVGSTPLTIDLSARYRLPNLSEIFNNPVRRPTAEAITLLESEKPFVWAFKPDQKTKANAEIVQTFLDASDIIKITRNDLVKQIASYYFMLKKLPVKHCIDKILQENQTIDNLTNYTRHIVYEDYPYLDVSFMTKPNIKPDNYDEICNSVSNILRQRGFENV
jgi:hypothetical protein